MSDDPQGTSHFQHDQPDDFDRAYGQAHGFTHTRPSTIIVSKALGVGGVRQYIIQTYRVPDAGDMAFITIAGPGGLKRIYLPPQVTAALASQRDSLTTKSRSRAAKERALADKAAGKVPGFMRGKKR